MTISICIDLGDKNDLAWAQEMVTVYHYLQQPVDPRARPMVYVIRHDRQRLGLIMVGHPHATKCGGWWGYPGLPTQWQVVDLCRIYLAPALQRGGGLAQPGIVPGFTDRHGKFRPTVASWAIYEVLKRVQQDRVAMYPPVYPEQPYHIRLVISYHDPKYHKGFIYRATNASPMYTTKPPIGPPEAKPGPSGKFGWCWELPEPAWTWEQIPILQPRNMRLALI